MPYKRLDEGAPEDTEGNMPLRIKVTEGSDADTDAEGNGIRIKIVKDGSDDDTEGNGVRVRIVKDGSDDDTEGNAG
jgi:hypothetical protein